MGPPAAPATYRQPRREISAIVLEFSIKALRALSDDEPRVLLWRLEPGP